MPYQSLDLIPKLHIFKKIFKNILIDLFRMDHQFKSNSIKIEMDKTQKTLDFRLMKYQLYTIITGNFLNSFIMINLLRVNKNKNKL